MEENEEIILTKPICVLICIFLIISMIFTSYIGFKYDFCYVEKDALQYLNLKKDEKVICAVMTLHLNVKDYYVVKYIPTYPFIFIDYIIVGPSENDKNAFYDMTCRNYLDYIFYIYNVLSFVAFVALQEHMDKI